MVIPGVVWSTVFIVLTLLPVWLETYFPGVIWVAPAAGLLAIAVKVWEVYKPADAPQGDFESASVSQSAGRTKRVLLG